MAFGSSALGLNPTSGHGRVGQQTRSRKDNRCRAVPLAHRGLALEAVARLCGRTRRLHVITYLNVHFFVNLAFFILI